MDSTSQPQTLLGSTSSSSFFSDPKNIIIFGLLLVLVLTFLGFNILYTLGDAFEKLRQLLGPLVQTILGLVGYTTGSVINKSADIAGTVTKFSVDVAEGSIQNVGGLLKNTSSPYVNDYTKKALDSVLTPEHDVSYVGEYGIGLPAQASAPIAPAPTAPAPIAPAPDTTENPIQKPITASKAGWCLVGEYQGVRGCVEVKDEHKCLSGQIFPSQKQCLDPSK